MTRHHVREEEQKAYYYYVHIAWTATETKTLPSTMP